MMWELVILDVLLTMMATMKTGLSMLDGKVEMTLMDVLQGAESRIINLLDRFGAKHVCAPMTLSLIDMEYLLDAIGIVRLATQSKYAEVIMFCQFMTQALQVAVYDLCLVLLQINRQYPPILQAIAHQRRPQSHQPLDYS